MHLFRLLETSLGHVLASLLKSREVQRKLAARQEGLQFFDGDAQFLDSLFLRRQFLQSLGAGFRFRCDPLPDIASLLGQSQPVVDAVACDLHQPSRLLARDANRHDFLGRFPHLPGVGAAIQGEAGQVQSRLTRPPKTRSRIFGLFTRNNIRFGRICKATIQIDDFLRHSRSG